MAAFPLPSQLTKTYQSFCQFFNSLSHFFHIANIGSYTNATYRPINRTPDVSAKNDAFSFASISLNFFQHRCIGEIVIAAVFAEETQIFASFLFGNAPFVL